MLKKRQKKKPQRDGLYPQGPHTYLPWQSGDIAQEHLGNGRLDLPLPQQPACFPLSAAQGVLWK